MRNLGTSASAVAAPLPQAHATYVVSSWARSVAAFVSATSVVGTLVAYGLLQEKVMAQPYAGDFFNFSLFLVLCNRLVAVAFAGSMHCFSGESASNRPPMWKYVVIALPNVIACWSQYEALKFVSYSVQMLGKSVRMLPSMCYGSVVDGRRYNCGDWFIAIAVAAGAVQYLTLGPIGSCRAPFETVFQNPKGIGMLFAFLGWDALASFLQDRLLYGHDVRTNRYGQVMHINLCAAIIAAGWLCASGDGLRALRFCFHRTTLVRDSFLLSASAVAGQWCIYSQVQEFGPAFFANTMTLRQLASTFASYVWFKHPFTMMQFSGLCCIFGALIYKGLVASLHGAGSVASAVAVRAATSSERTPLRFSAHAHEARAVKDNSDQFGTSCEANIAHKAEEAA